MTKNELLNRAYTYNWWTPEEKKNGISLEANLGSIMGHGDAREVFALFQTFDIADIVRGYDSVKDDTFLLNTRRR